MTGDDLDLRLRRRQDTRGLAHGAVLGLERPQDELGRSRRRQPLAADGPIERAHACAVTRHPHVLAIGQAPAVQRRLLHGRDHEPPVRAHERGEMRAFPFQRLGRALRVREPERDAVVMRDGEANTFRGERQSADGRWHLEHALGTLAAARKRLLARRPRDRAVRADRHMVDPAALAVGGHHRAVALASVDTTLPSSPPVTMRPASAVEHRMAPPCTAAVRTSPVFGTNSSASSPSTNTAVWPRKCAATTGASALSGRVRSTTEGISLLVSVTAQSPLSGDAVYEIAAHSAALEGGSAWNR